MRHIVKVCGMREPDNIRAVVALGIDLMGFIFWPKSSRYVERMDSTPGSSAAEIARLIPTIPCKRVGVFVDEDIETVRRIAADYALDYIQLHGSESPDYLRALREACSVYGCATAAPLLIKAFNIATAEDLEQTAPYAGLADLFLFDTRTPSKAMGGSHLPGGTGQKFDWSVLSDYNGRRIQPVRNELLDELLRRYRRGLLIKRELDIVIDTEIAEDMPLFRIG